jgi:putative transposase
MVEHPASYPWSSYHFNALGNEDELVTPHRLYNRPGATPEERQTACRQLFKARVAGKSLEEIRCVTNKGMGGEHFKRRIASQLKRRVAPKKQGRRQKSDG